MGNQYTSYTEIMKYLDAQMNMGKRWAAYEGLQLPDSHFLLECFESSMEASNYCASNLYRTTVDGELVDVNFNFHAVENLIKELQLAKGVKPTMLVTPAAVEDMLQAHGVITTSDFLHPVASSGLPFGGILPVMKPLQITPLELMEQFHIVRHVHESVGLIYELGHARGILASYPDYGQAEAALVQHATELPAETKRTSYELILVGQFKDQVLWLDYEGRPEFNSGLPLKTAYSLDGQMKINLIHDPHKEMTIHQRFFTRYNEERGKMVFLDDRLNEITPGATIQSYYEGHFWSNMELLLHISQSSDQDVRETKQVAANESTKVPSDPAKRLLKIACSKRINTRSKKRKKDG